MNAVGLANNPEPPEEDWGELLGYCPHCDEAVWSGQDHEKGFAGYFHAECVEELCADPSMQWVYVKDMAQDEFMKWLRDGMVDELFADYIYECCAPEFREWVLS